MHKHKYVRKIGPALLFCLLLSIVAHAQYSSVVYYIVAHPDDWQLFMGVNAFDDITAKDSRKVVLIYTTAGDGNCTGKNINKVYYLARQLGANRSVQFCADIKSKHDTLRSRLMTFQGIYKHNVLQFRYKNVVSYFLRLPDGCLETTRTATIGKLAQGAIKTLTAFDSSATYHGYEDLVETIENIIQREGAGYKKVTINAPEWDLKLNPDDHPDHVQTGRLATEIATKIPCVNLNLYQGYSTTGKPVNLSTEDIAKEAALLGQLATGMSLIWNSTEWDPYSPSGHVALTSRNYYRNYISCDSTVQANIAFSYLDSNLVINRNSVKAFPNPASNNINITYELMDSGMVTIGVYDMNGYYFGTILNEQRHAGINTVDYNTEALRPGQYLIFVKTAQNIQSVPFIKEYQPR